MKSTNNVVVAKIRDHILNRLDEDHFGTLPQLMNAVGEFKHWLGDRRYPSQYEAFKAYLQCVPSAFAAEFSYHYQHKALTDWLGEPKKDYSEDEVENQYYSLVYREFRKLCEIYGIRF